MTGDGSEKVGVVTRPTAVADLLADFSIADRQ
jgi:hypothetical protein